jgi:hypothetical protein
MVKCLCTCGRETVIRRSRLFEREKIGCGCLAGKWTRHGESHTKLYTVWDHMIMRCHNPSHQAYPRYGARGITVCDQWRDYVKFRNWAIANGYKEGLSIDRINNDNGYNPANCRWATRKEQQNNRHNNAYIAYQGQIKTVTEWAQVLKMSVNAARRFLGSNEHAKRTDYSTAYLARMQQRPG